MSKFCGNCGAEMSDDAVFCGSCGQKPEETAKTEVAEETVATAAAPKGINVKLIAIVAGAVLALILIIVLLCSGGGAQSALNNYANVMMNPTVDNIKKLAPEEYWESLVDISDFDYEDILGDDYEDLIGDELEDILDNEEVKDLIKEGVDEILEESAEAMEESLESLEDYYGDNIRVSATINEEDEVKKSVLNDAKDNMKDAYGINKKDVTKMVELDVTMKIVGSEDEDEDDTTMYAVCIKGQWYICSASGRLLSFM